MKYFLNSFKIECFLLSENNLFPTHSIKKVMIYSLIGFRTLLFYLENYKVSSMSVGKYLCSPILGTKNAVLANTTSILIKLSTLISLFLAT